MSLFPLYTPFIAIVVLNLALKKIFFVKIITTLRSTLYIYFKCFKTLFIGGYDIIILYTLINLCWYTVLL